VDHAVSGPNIRGRHLGFTIDVHATRVLRHQYLLAFKRRDMLLSLEVLAVDGGAGNHVVLQNGIQLFDVFRLQQTVQSRLGNLREGLVSWGKNGERAFALQSSDELAGSESSHKCRQVLVACGEFDDIFARCACLCRREQHGVDDVDHAVSGPNIRGRHLGFTIDVHATRVLRHQYLLAFKRRDMLLSLEVLAVDGGAGNHVVLQNGIQLFDVFRLQQTVQSRLGNLREGLVSWGKNGERAFALQSSDELACFKGGHER